MNTEQSSRSTGGLIAAGILGAALVGVALAVVLVSGRTPSNANAERAAGEAEVTPRVGQAPPETVDALANTLQTLVAEQDYERARLVLASASRQYPDDPDIRLHYAEALQAVRDYDGAHAQYMTLIERGHGGAEVEFLAGMVSSSGAHPERAAEHFERALKLDPDNAEYALNLGAVQMNLGRQSEAVATLTIARSLDPELAKAWGMLAEISRRKGERTAAIQYIARARELEPAEVNWRVIEADAFLMREPERSVELLSGLSGSDLRRPDVLRIVKAAYGRLGRHEDAAWVFSDASDEQPDNAGLAIETAELFERAGDLDNAIFYATRAVQAGDDGARSMLLRLRDEAGR